MLKTKVLLLGGGVAALAGFAFAAQAGARLLINGKLASSDVRVIGGKVYIPMADVARALNLSVSKTGSTYALAAAGGANELVGYRGKQGDVVFTGKWRFSVLDWKRVDTYTATLMKRNHWDERYSAKSDEDLIVVSCRIKNGTKKTDQLVFPIPSQPLDTNHALTDTEEHAYAPAGFDVTESVGGPPGVSFLPGAAIDFKMIFRVPRGTTPKDVVFTALRYDSYALYLRKNDPPQDIRITLAKEE